MFERVSQIAEQAATNVSRRQFFGRVGNAALVLAATLGGVLAIPGSAAAAVRPCSSNADCHRGYVCVNGRCTPPPQLCGANSAPECQGRVVGSSCGSFGYGTYCFYPKRSTSDYCVCGRM